MLTPDYLAHCSDTIVSQYERLHEQITQDICRRVIKTGEITATASWQAKMLQESGKLYEDIVKDVAKETGRTYGELDKLFNEAGVLSVKYDAEPLIRAGLKVETGLSPSMQQILEANARSTSNDFTNLCMTTASSGQEEFIQAMNESLMMVESGSFDPDTALRRVIDKASQIGGSVLYPSGNKMSLEAAARMNIMTGVNRTVSRITEMNAETLGAQYYETSAHLGARPTHSVWQGQVFKIEGADGDHENFYEATGYGEPDGLCGINCRHSFYPYFPGISEPAYTDEMLEEYNNRSVEYNGVEYDEYEASQIQRRYERAIRESKYKIAGYDKAIEECKDHALRQQLEDYRAQAQQTLNARRQRLTDFCNQTGREKDYTRTKISSGAVSSNAPARSNTTASTVVNGKDLSDTWTRRTDKFKFEIDDVVNAQGFDGKPKILSGQAFDDAVKDSNFIAQRTYSAPDKDILNGYRKELYEGKWYVDCSTGGAAYGSGMYCAGNYKGVLTDDIIQEMKDYAGIRKYYINGKSMSDNTAIHKIAEKYAEDNGVRKIEARKVVRSEFNSGSTIEELCKKYNVDFKQGQSFVETITFTKDAKIAMYDDIKKMFDNDINKNVEDLGSYAALKGYDAIRTTAGTSGADTVILNRTKVIFKGD